MFGSAGRTALAWGGGGGSSYGACSGGTFTGASGAYLGGPSNPGGGR